MYNPDYLERPYIVVLNKIDIPKVCFFLHFFFLFSFFLAIEMLPGINLIFSTVTAFSFNKILSSPKFDFQLINI